MVHKSLQITFQKLHNVVKCLKQDFVSNKGGYLWFKCK